MKTRIFGSSPWLLALATASIALAVSQLGETNAQSGSTSTPVASAPAVSATTEAVPVANERTEVPTAAVPADLSPGLAEVIKLAQGHVSEDVLLAFIKNSGQNYAPTADEIVYLNDLGVSDTVITELLHRSPPSSDVAKTPQAVQPAVNNSPAPAPIVESNPAPPAPAMAEAAPIPATPPPQQVTVNYFYDSLAPYGSWVEVSDYGRCWRPTVVVNNPGWRPYADRGRWVYTDCGWYWQSDYSWGWAAFHYGRWHNDFRFGWVWVPDCTWGPSWVSWRHNDAYCGWAPLPPRARYEVGVGLVFNHGRVGVGFDFGISDSWFTFVSYNRFCDPHPYRYYAPRSQNTVIYKNTTVINNYITKNNTVINEGVGRDRVARNSHQQVQKVVLHDVAVSSTKTGGFKPDRFEHGGKSLGVFRPNVAVVAAPLAPKTASTAVSTSVAPRTAPASISHLSSPVNSTTTVHRSAPKGFWNGSHAAPAESKSTTAAPVPASASTVSSPVNSTTTVHHSAPQGSWNGFHTTPTESKSTTGAATTSIQSVPAPTTVHSPKWQTWNNGGHEKTVQPSAQPKVTGQPAPRIADPSATPKPSPHQSSVSERPNAFDSSTVREATVTPSPRFSPAPTVTAPAAPAPTASHSFWSGNNPSHATAHVESARPFVSTQTPSQGRVTPQARDYTPPPSAFRSSVPAPSASYSTPPAPTHSAAPSPVYSPAPSPSAAPAHSSAAHSSPAPSHAPSASPSQSYRSERSSSDKSGRP